MLGKQDIAESVSADTGLSVKMSLGIVERMLGLIGEEVMTNGNTVKLPYFGSFSVIEKSQRVGRNVRTGEPAIIHPRAKLRFSPTKAFRELAVKG